MAGQVKDMVVWVGGKEKRGKTPKEGFLKDMNDS
jgi:hypothetical protein